MICMFLRSVPTTMCSSSQDQMVSLCVLTWLPYGAAFTAAWIASTEQVISFEVADFDDKASLSNKS